MTTNKPTSSPFPPTRSSTPNPNSLLARMGSKVSSTLIPTANEIVCFDLDALKGEALQALGLPGYQEPLTELLRDLREQAALAPTLQEPLDQHWRGCGLHGAALVYDWRSELREGIAVRLKALKQPPVYLLAADALLVLNVVGRARGVLLLANAPLALEQQFLTRVLASDDPRLIRLVHSSGFSRETLVVDEAETEENS